jgi:glycosyltransferase involved in cell wall biosynthesis
MPKTFILYDGWPLVYQPNQPAAMHLHALLEHHPTDISAGLALPGEPAFPLPADLVVHKVAASPGDLSLLTWEQRTFPQLAEALHARLVHRTLGGPALLGARKTLVSPAEFGAGAWFEKDGQPREPWRRHASLVGRVREALISGGMERARGLLWPTDLPPLTLDVPVFSLPTVVPGAFWKAQTGHLSPQHLDLPEAFVLYQGPLAQRDLRRLLDAWSWAAASIGDLCPLVVLGVDGEVRAFLENLTQEYGLVGTVRTLSILPLGDLAIVYNCCSALLHPLAVSPWGGPLHLALACGKPIVGVEDRLSSALAGPAAYLIPNGDSWTADCRALGAALVTVVVEASVANSLADQARQRAAGWKTADPLQFSQHLRAVYQLLAVG